MQRTLEEINQELNGKIAIYRQEIQNLNAALNRKNHSSKKLRERYESLQETYKDLQLQNESSWGDSWDSENPDRGAA